MHRYYRRHQLLGLLITISTLCYLLEFSRAAEDVLQYPGARVILTDRAISFVRDEFVGFIKRKFKRKTQRLPNSSLDHGKFLYRFTEMRLRRLAAETATIHLEPGLMAEIICNDVSVTLIGKWQSQKKGWNRIEEGGWLRGRVANGSVSMIIDLKELDSNSSYDCFTDINVDGIDFLGRKGLFRHLKEVISAKATTAAKQQVCKDLYEAIRDFVRKHHIVDTFYYLRNYLVLDYGLVEEPNVISNSEPDLRTVDSVILNLKSSFHWFNQSGFPFVPKQLPQFLPPSGSDGTQPMILYIISDYVANTLFHTAFHHDLLKYYVRPLDVDERYRGTMRTICDGYCLENLLSAADKEKHKESLIEVYLRSNHPPKFYMEDGQGIIRWSGSASFYSRFPSNISEYMFTFSADAAYKVGIMTKHSKVITNFELLNVSALAVHKSYIGQISHSKLDRLFRGINHIFIEPKLNKLGQVGLRLPRPAGITFQHLHLHRLSGAIAVWGDLMRKKE